MSVRGVSFIGGKAVSGSGKEIQGFDPAAGHALDPVYRGASRADVAEACALAAAAFDAYRETKLEDRARFLEAIAEQILALGDELIERAMAETGLLRGRLEGERGRTVGQLRMFADVVRRGEFLDLRIDTALPDRKPAPRPDLRLRNIALGPVAVFGASNFPLAFSVAGGDTASALAAGCPVVVKAHPAHPGTSELVASAIVAAVAACGLPAGVFSMLMSAQNEVAGALVADPNIKAVGFTGSRQGGLALVGIAAKRREPIPVYAEMSAINPVILFPGALKERGAAIGKAFVDALVLGSGQFCTNPGLILAMEGDDLAAFFEGAGVAIEGVEAAPMLTPGIYGAYERGMATLANHPAVKTVAKGKAGEPYRGQAAIFETKAATFAEHEVLAEEVFGPSSLVVRCRDLKELEHLLERLEGQLTAALHISEEDYPAAKAVLPILERKVGRILINGFGTGVEVAHAMVHGGPFPATSDSRTTSVGSLAINRFLRPVSYQNLPQALLPDVLTDAGAAGVQRLVDGATMLPSA